MTPHANQVTLPSILDSVPPTIMQGYPVETAIAEKFEAMVTLGMTNSRMKDLFDIAFLADTMTLSSKLLGSAIAATFNRRRTELPKISPYALTEGFIQNSQVIARWNAFVKKNRISIPYSDLAYVQRRISDLLVPLLETNHSDMTWIDGEWQGPYQAADEGFCD